MADACGPSSAERHRLDEQVDIDLIHRTAAVGELADEPVNDLLIAAEDESSERMRCTSCFAFAGTRPHAMVRAILKRALPAIIFA